MLGLLEIVSPFHDGGCVTIHHLRQDDFFVYRDIAKAEGLPPAAFTDPEFLQLELETIFTHSWLLIPQEAVLDVPKVIGAQTPFSLLDNPLFLQRDRGCRFGCYPNVCTHAAYPLVRKTGVVDRIVCGQHGRNFTLEGQAGDPKFVNSKKFPRACDHLKALPIRSWSQFLFTALGAPSVGFDTTISQTRISTSLLSFSKWKYVFGADTAREVNGNWKQHAWNYLDSMHIPLIHRAPRGLADAVEPSSYQTEVYDHSVLQWAYATDPRTGFAHDLLPARFRDPLRPEKKVFALWWFVFPNMAFNLYPWGLSVNVYTPVPKHPEKTLFHWHHFVADEKLYRLRNQVWHMSKVDKEDTEAIEASSRGLRSAFAVRGLFAPEREIAPHWFHRLVYQTVFLS